MEYETACISIFSKEKQINHILGFYVLEVIMSTI
jgi:hypothetical protein